MSSSASITIGSRSLDVMCVASSRTYVHGSWFDAGSSCSCTYIESVSLYIVVTLRSVRAISMACSMVILPSAVVTLATF
uniref:Uncharacterized protein n=1 Tax=Spodoptera frugiperda ascovirus 1a TaxID=113370 RepID=Q9DKL9_SFAVA|nr:hypothetical protein [Spodoptera frugiperda ascovirus 1a]